MTSRRCLIELPPSQILNSNTLPKNTFVKSQKARNIRLMGQEWGIDYHDDIAGAKAHVEAINQLKDLKSRASQITKASKKKGANQDELNKLSLELEKEKQSVVVPKIDYLFDCFVVSVFVCPPTRQKVDPPNLYPTIKPFIDGLTDAGWWEDDNFTQLLNMDFSYGGLSGNKSYLIVLDIESTKNKNYIVESVDRRSELWQMKN